MCVYVFLKHPKKVEVLKYHPYSEMEDGNGWNGGAKILNVGGRRGRSAMQRSAGCVVCHSVTCWDMGKGSYVRAPTIAVTNFPRLARTTMAGIAGCGMQWSRVIPTWTLPDSQAGQHFTAAGSLARLTRGSKWFLRAGRQEVLLLLPLLPLHQSSANCTVLNCSAGRHKTSVEGFGTDGNVAC